MDNRFRNFTIVSYSNEEELYAMIRNIHARVRAFAYVIHDRDIYLEDRLDNDGNVVTRAGELERVHIQMCLVLFNGASVSAVRKLFSDSVNTAQVQVVTDMRSMFRYLTHKDNPEKFQYSDDDIRTNDIDYFRNLERFGDKRNVDNIAECIINDLINHVSPRLMLHRYGRDYVIHREMYKSMVDEILQYDYHFRGITVQLDDSSHVSIQSSVRQRSIDDFEEIEDDED